MPFLSSAGLFGFRQSVHLGGMRAANTAQRIDVPWFSPTAIERDRRA